jgi:hypothetical protein
MPAATCAASSTVSALALLASVSCIPCRRSANSCRSSVAMIVSIEVPSTRQWCLSNAPQRYSSMPTLSAVCPPMLTMQPSGRSLRSTSSQTCRCNQLVLAHTRTGQTPKAGRLCYFPVTTESGLCATTLHYNVTLTWQVMGRK